MFIRECGACHSLIEDTVIVGPSLAGVATRAKEGISEQDPRIYLMTAILRPCESLVEGFECLMPENFGKKLTGEEVDAVIAYLLTFE